MRRSLSWSVKTMDESEGLRQIEFFMPLNCEDLRLVEAPLLSSCKVLGDPSLFVAENCILVISPLSRELG